MWIFTSKTMSESFCSVSTASGCPSQCTSVCISVNLGLLQFHSVSSASGCPPQCTSVIQHAYQPTSVCFNFFLSSCLYNVIESGFLRSGGRYLPLDTISNLDPCAAAAAERYHLLAYSYLLSYLFLISEDQLHHNIVFIFVILQAQLHVICCSLSCSAVLSQNVTV